MVSFWGFLILLFLICFFCYFTILISVDYQRVMSNQQDFKNYVIIWILNHMIIATLENCYYHQPHDFPNRKNKRIGHPVFQ